MYNNKKNDLYFIGVDIGSTTIRACLYDSLYNLINFSEEKLKTNSNKEDIFEIDWKSLWYQFKNVLLKVVKKVDSNKIFNVGLCCQRNTFITWNSKTLEPCHQFISWKDQRSKKLCDVWNQSFSLKFFNFCGSILYFFTGSQRFKAVKYFKFHHAMVNLRFMSIYQQSDIMKKLAAQNCLAFGCIDTWLISKLTNGQKFITEHSSASSTGLFDNFTNCWSSIIMYLIKFPKNVLLPQVVESTSLQVISHPKVLPELTIKILASLGDAQAATIGAGGYKSNLLIISLGTGSFLDYTIQKIKTSSTPGLFSLINWTNKKEINFLIEGHINNTAEIIKWAQEQKILEDLNKTSNIVNLNTSDKCFIFFPSTKEFKIINKNNDFLKLVKNFNLKTNCLQLAHAVLEAIAFEVFKIFELMNKEISEFKNCTLLRCCGGVSNNDLVCQTIADLFNLSIERVNENSFCAAKGVALISGLALEHINDKQINKFIEVNKIFVPNIQEREHLLKRYKLWIKNTKY